MSAGGNTLHQRPLIECSLEIKEGAKSVRWPRMRSGALLEIDWHSCQKESTCKKNHTGQVNWGTWIECVVWSWRWPSWSYLLREYGVSLFTFCSFHRTSVSFVLNFFKSIFVVEHLGVWDKYGQLPFLKWGRSFLRCLIDNNPTGKGLCALVFVGNDITIVFVSEWRGMMRSTGIAVGLLWAMLVSCLKSYDRLHIFLI